MKLLIPLLLLSTLSAFGEVSKSVHRTSSSEIYRSGGQYFIYKGDQRENLAPDTPDYKVSREGGQWVIYHFESKKINYANGGTPFKNPPVRMTKETCGSKDLSQAMGPVRDQTADTCYANNAVDLIAFGSNKNLSPLALAINVEGNYPVTQKDHMKEIIGFQPGSVFKAIQAAYKHGYCTDDVAPATQNLGKEMNAFLKYYKDSTKLQEEMDKELAECRLSVNSPQDVIQHAADISRAYSKLVWKASEAKNLGKNIFPTLADSDYLNAFNRSKNATDYLRLLYAKACEGQKDKSLFDRELRYHQSFKDKPTEVSVHAQMHLLDHVNEQLNAGYPSSVYVHMKGLILKNAKEQEGHGVMVAGRQWDEKTNQCLYLAKNSFGTKWTPEGVKAKAAPGKPGYLLISEKALLEHAYQAISLPRKN